MLIPKQGKKERRKKEYPPYPRASSSRSFIPGRAQETPFGINVIVQQTGRGGKRKTKRLIHNLLLVQANKLFFLFPSYQKNNQTHNSLSFIIFQRVVIVWPVNLSVPSSPLLLFFRSDSSRTDVFRWVSADLETVRSSNHGVQARGYFEVWTASCLTSPRLISHRLTWTCLGGPS